jgi:hypothetical protein
VQASLFDQGKMWTFEFPPMDYLAREYGFRPDQAWFEKARLASLRLSNCSASFVSPHGLVMTNHHCARESVVHASKPGENLLDKGFFPKSLAEERGDGRGPTRTSWISTGRRDPGRWKLGWGGPDRAQCAEQREDILKAVGDRLPRAAAGQPTSSSR